MLTPGLIASTGAAKVPPLCSATMTVPPTVSPVVVETPSTVAPVLYPAVKVATLCWPELARMLSVPSIFR